mgnify:FL=1
MSQIQNLILVILLQTVQIGIIVLIAIFVYKKFIKK